MSKLRSAGSAIPPYLLFNLLVGTDPASFENFAGLVADLSGEARMSVAGAVRLKFGGFGKTALPL
jgi:hypothetical protein